MTPPLAPALRTDTPTEQIGFIAPFEATGREEALAHLQRATAELARQGHTLAVGPIDGSTWGTYRLVTDRAPHGGDPLPPFFLEPNLPDEHVRTFRDAGFAEWTRYVSSLVPDLRRAEPPGSAPSGITIRTADPDDLAGEVRRLHPLIMESFAEAPLFQPITESEFLEVHRPLLDAIDPSLVLIAEADAPGHPPVGVCLTLPDRAQAVRGETVDTAIVKTLAVHPDVRRCGLGTHLVARAHQAALSAGYRRAIHALMHASAASRSISARDAMVIRHYALFARPLDEL